ncbi:glucosylceramidase, variant [Capsaspora owczarzaki ATCC 30864]|nr:glucosylceramidase, variant [Capsaspora owczarzaki ATCC 30864]
MAVNVGAMTADIQELILENYYGATGLGYALGRIPIASCDFSTHMYSYNDLYGDYQMTNFSVDVDVASGKIGMIQKALSLRQEALQAGLFSAPLGPIDDAALGPVGVLTNNHSMVLFASSWSPPAWLKTTQSRVKGSLNGTAGDAVHKAYALYLSKFLDAYAAHGIEVAYLSMQNEPSMSVRWDSCFFSPVTERDFIKTDLGPLMRQNHPDVGLIMLDDQRLEMDIWLDIVLSDADAAQYVNVTGMHWYSSANDVLDEFQYLRYAHDKYPNMLLLATEACAGEEVIDRGVVFGSWYRGITYFKDISGDFNNWAIGWTDWPGVVDLQGGPNHAGNWVDSAIVANTTAGTEFYKNPMFYALGHFSLFAPANSSRLEVTVQYGPDQPNTLKLEITAFLRPDGLVSVMIGNTDEIHPRAISIAHPTQGYINLVVPNASMQTLVFKL